MRRAKVFSTAIVAELIELVEALADQGECECQDYVVSERPCLRCRAAALLKEIES